MTAKPKVHWVSPIPNAQTDIAHYTHRILPELAEAPDYGGDTLYSNLYLAYETLSPGLQRLLEGLSADPDQAFTCTVEVLGTTAPSPGSRRIWTPTWPSPWTARSAGARSNPPRQAYGNRYQS